MTRHRPSWRAWIIVGALAVLALWWGLPRWHRYLMPQHTVASGGAMVLEGWGTDLAAQVAADAWKAKQCPAIWTTGIPIERGTLLVGWKNFAQSAEATLEKMGVASEAAIAVPTPSVASDRTMASAQALKPLLEAEVVAGRLPKRLTVISMGAHSRRTWNVYKRVFGPEWEIGIHAMPPTEYDPTRWWTSSNGLKLVVLETVSMLYDVVRL